MSRKDSVSIITPLYNAEKTIVQTIESVLAQSYKNWEMLIVNDYSSDNSKEIITKYMLVDHRIKYIELQENKGAAYARNKALEKAVGRYIAFLDADDFWKPRKLEEQIAFMQKKNIALSYTSYDVINQEGEIRKIFKAKAKISYIDMLKTSQIGCLTAIYDTDKLGKVYMPMIRKRQDYALWLHILKQIGHAEGLQNSLAVYRITKSSLSSNKFKAAQYQWKVYREFEKLSYIKALYYFLHYAYNGIKKYK